MTKVGAQFIEDIFIQAGENSEIPLQGSENAAGSDLFAAEDVVLKPGEKKLISTEIKMEIPEHLLCLILPRSGMTKNTDFRVANTPGLIDPDYRGEVKVMGENVGQEDIYILKGERIAQVIFMPFIQPNWVIVDELSETERNDGGFGHTGR